MTCKFLDGRSLDSIPRYMALGQSFSIDLIFLSWDNKTIQAPSRPCIQKFSILKDRYGGQVHGVLATFLATLRESPAQPRELGALTLYFLHNFASGCPQANSYYGKFQAAKYGSDDKVFWNHSHSWLGNLYFPTHHLHPHTTPQKIHLIRIPIMLQ